MKLAYTRTMVLAALSGELAEVGTHTDPVFGLQIPDQVEGVPAEVLQPRSTWADPAEYDAQANKLAAMFRKNFKKFEAQVSEAVRKAGPAE
jgi:phosphoenolpyruvate carboxykinase (ATP)